MRLLRRLRGDERGALLVFVAAAIVALLGLIALSFDLGRMASTQTELQSFADNVALAAAGELDGREDSIERATSAANSLITDTQTFGQGGAELDLDDFTLTFLASLGDELASPPTGDVVTTDPTEARLVRVDVTPRVVGLVFASVLFSPAEREGLSTGMGATAVAGFTQYACAITPMMFCLPEAGYTAEANIGDMVILHSGGSASWGPGNFGFIDVASLAVDPNGPCGDGKLSGRNLYSCLVGADGPLTQCVQTRGELRTEPGHREGVAEAAFNVRFDIFRATMSGEANQEAYAPAPNVIKGVMPKGGGSCVGMNGEPTGNTIALPRDTCFATGTCPFPRFGDGTWAATEYVQRNHNGTAPPTASDADPRLAGTRYQMYLDEIAAAGASAPLVPAVDTVTINTTLTPPLDCTISTPRDSRCVRWERRPSGDIVTRTETGRPMCSKFQSDDVERRVIIAAGVDCTTNPVSGGGSSVVAEEFFRIFLTEPARDDGLSPPNVDIAGEIIGTAGRSGSSGVFRDVVQLYR